MNVLSVWFQCQDRSWKPSNFYLSKMNNLMWLLKWMAKMNFSRMWELWRNAVQRNKSMAIDENVENMRRFKVCYVATCELKTIQTWSQRKKSIGRNSCRKKNNIECTSTCIWLIVLAFLCVRFLSFSLFTCFSNIDLYNEIRKCIHVCISKQEWIICFSSFLSFAKRFN